MPKWEGFSIESGRGEIFARATRATRAIKFGAPLTGTSSYATALLNS
jgi:hypothetical protein